MTATVGPREDLRPDYVAPTTLEAALGLLADGGPATVLGGGTLVLPRLAREVPTRRRLVDLARIDDLGRLVTTDGTTTIGATVTYAGALGSPACPPLLRLLGRGITGGPQIRNQGTPAGSACYANPSSDVPGALVALDATMVLADVHRSRRLPAREFFRGPFTTALDVGELLVAVEVPDPAPTAAWGYRKLKHGGSGWPVATASAVVDRDPDGAITAARVTLGAVAAVPFTVALPPALLDDVASERTAAAVRDLVASADPEWWTDEQADATYRRRVAAPVAVRALSDALAVTPDRSPS
jgi:aerobic carbon-monoxide dehydrogenase medium subunit